MKQRLLLRQYKGLTIEGFPSDVTCIFTTELEIEIRSIK